MLDDNSKDSFREDLYFRLLLNKAVNANPPLNEWVIRKLVSDKSFEQLLNDALEKIQPDLPSQGAYSALSFFQRQKLFEKLSGDPRLALLVAERAEKSNQRIKVLIGLASKLEGIWEEDRKPHPEKKEKDSGCGCGNCCNPLPQWTLIIVLLLIALGSVGSALLQTREASKEMADTLKQQPSEIAKELANILRPRSQDSKTIIETIPKDRNPQGTAPSQIVLPSPIRVKIGGSVSLVTSPQDHGTSFGQTQNKAQGQQQPDALSNTWKIKLEGLPALPSSLRLESPDHPDALPVSTVVLEPNDHKEIVVVYPATGKEGDSKQTVNCTLTATLKDTGDPAEIAFGKNAESACPVPPNEFIETIRLNQKPVYVPQLNAFVNLTSWRQGMLRGLRRKYQISIQAAPYTAWHVDNKEDAGPKPCRPPVCVL